MDKLERPITIWDIEDISLGGIRTGYMESNLLYIDRMKYGVNSRTLLDVIITGYMKDISKISPHGIRTGIWIRWDMNWLYRRLFEDLTTWNKNGYMD